MVKQRDARASPKKTSEKRGSRRQTPRLKAQAPGPFYLPDDGTVFWKRSVILYSGDDRPAPPLVRDGAKSPLNRMHGKRTVLFLRQKCKAGREVRPYVGKNRLVCLLADQPVFYLENIKKSEKCSSPDAPDGYFTPWTASLMRRT